ncbi:UPF0481 protein At3g47200-like [Bidens hawaiensis]|uniref:UPF0481 protein At3g47200-like n=1 Tax=Bidens hawaiensis TaxID=980011 RepID=UPI00404AC3A0
MSIQDLTQRDIEVNNGDQLEDERWVMDSIISANAPLPSLSTSRIHRVPEMVTETGDYDKYYVPKVVSIGPHHFGNKKLEFVEKLKPVFAMKLFSNNKETLRSLYKSLGDPKMVQELRNFYEENTTTKFCNKVFTKIMLLDCCFILYYIQYIFGEKPEDSGGLSSHQIVFVHQDLFLLENQIPFKVLMEGMKLIEFNWLKKIKPFIHENILASIKPKRKWLEAILYIQNDRRSSREEREMELISDNEPNDHLLHLLHRTLTKHVKVPVKNSNPKDNYRCTFRNVNELMDVGIHFKPSDTMSLAHVKFINGRLWFSAAVELPPIIVDDSTKPMLKNLIAYEMCTNDACNAWVTSYICLLDSLIDQPEDVKALRKVGVLENSLGSDKEVAKLFNEIGTDLVPNSLAYLEAMNMIQRHYESWSNTLISQLKHEYVKSPWAFFALLGALIALFFGGVQAYFTVWSPKGDCDKFCEFLKNNHHL